MSARHDQSGEDASGEDADSPNEDSPEDEEEEEEDTSGEDPPEENVDMNVENQTGDEADEPLNSEDDDIIGGSPSGSGDVDDPSPPRTRLPSREIVLQHMRRIRDAYGVRSAEWNTLLSWIEARHRAYIGIHEELARDDRNRQPRGSDDSEMDDPDKTESDSSAEPSRRNRGPRPPTPSTDNDSGSVVGLKTSSSSSDDKELNRRPSYDREVVTILLADSRRITVRFDFPQQASVENPEIRDSGSNRSTPQPADCATENNSVLNEISGDVNSGKYKPCEFILKSGEQVEKICGSPISNARLPYCAEHMRQAVATERESAASSSGTSAPTNNALNKAQEEPKLDDHQPKPSS